MNCGECGLVGDLNYSHRHISQYLMFQGTLEFFGYQLVASSAILSEPPTQRKQRAYSTANVFLGSEATRLRWGREVCMCV